MEEFTTVPDPYQLPCSAVDLQLPAYAAELTPKISSAKDGRMAMCFIFITLQFKFIMIGPSVATSCPLRWSEGPWDGLFRSYGGNQLNFPPVKLGMDPISLKWLQNKGFLNLNVSSR